MLQGLCSACVCERQQSHQVCMSSWGCLHACAHRAHERLQTSGGNFAMLIYGATAVAITCKCSASIVYYKQANKVQNQTCHLSRNACEQGAWALLPNSMCLQAAANDHMNW